MIKNPPLKRDGIWFHSCSFGEARAIAPVVEMFDKDLIRLTTTTQTGFSVIKNISKESRYLPFETLLPFWIKPQKVLIVLEAELWYMLFLVAKSKGAFTILLNARVSTRSFPKYKKFAWFYRKVFENIDKVYAQTSEDAKRLSALGAKNIEVLGNIKLISIPKPTKKYPKPQSLTIVAGSTHEGEEELILENFLELKSKNKDAKLIIVPRHPERFLDVESLIWKQIEDKDLTFSRFGRDGSLKEDIILVDLMGELVNFYKIANIVILGGSFVPVGGHNFAEAAQFGCSIISGEYVFNQRDILNSVDGVIIIKKEELKDRLLEFDSLPKSALRVKSIEIEKFVREVESVL